MVPFQNQVSSKCTGLNSFPSEAEKAPSGKVRFLHNGYSKTGPAGVGASTSSTGQSLATVTTGRCELPGVFSHLCTNQSSPGSQWACPSSYAVTHLAFEGVSLGLWWAQQLHLKGTIPLFHSTGTSAGGGVHWAFPAVMAHYPTGQGTSEHLASCWVHPDGALGNWGCNRQRPGDHSELYWSELGQIHLSLDLQKSLPSWGGSGTPRNMSVHFHIQRP